MLLLNSNTDGFSILKNCISVKQQSWASCRITSGLLTWDLLEEKHKGSMKRQSDAALMWRGGPPGCKHTMMTEAGCTKHKALSVTGY